MQRRVRFSIAGLMLAVLIASLAFAVVRTESSTCEGLVFLLTRGMLALAVVGAICRTSWGRVWWLGFALFGIGYLAIVGSHEASAQLRNLPTTTAFNFLWKNLGGGSPPKPGFAIPRAYGFGSTLDYDDYLNVAHNVWAILIATIGGGFSLLVFASSESLPMPQRVEPQPAAWSPTSQRVRRLKIGIAALLLAGLIVLVALLVPAGIWAGAAFLLTWGLLGAFALGALFGIGRLRAACLGAALFGATYLLLITGSGVDTLPMRRATNQFLEHVRPGFLPAFKGFPASSGAMASTNLRILDALEQPIPLHFPEETPLEDVLKAVREATVSPQGPAIPIYVDPVGLQEAEKTMQSPVTIDLVGVPLKTTLPLILAQLNLYYKVREGVLLITSKSSVDDPLIEIYEDPFLLLGYSILALLAAGIGGTFAALIAPRPPGQPADLHAAATAEAR